MHNKLRFQPANGHPLTCSYSAVQEAFAEQIHAFTRSPSEAKAAVRFVVLHGSGPPGRPGASLTAPRCRSVSPPLAASAASRAVLSDWFRPAELLPGAAARPATKLGWALVFFCGPAGQASFGLVVWSLGSRPSSATCVQAVLLSQSLTRSSGGPEHHRGLPAHRFVADFGAEARRV